MPRRVSCIAYHRHPLPIHVKNISQSRQRQRVGCEQTVGCLGGHHVSGLRACSRRCRRGHEAGSLFRGYASERGEKLEKSAMQPPHVRENKRRPVGTRNRNRWYWLDVFGRAWSLQGGWALRSSTFHVEQCRRARKFEPQVQRTGRNSCCLIAAAYRTTCTHSHTTVCLYARTEHRQTLNRTVPPTAQYRAQGRQVTVHAWAGLPLTS